MCWEPQPVVDVQPVRPVVDDREVGPELAEHRRRDLVRRTVADVHRDLHPFERQGAGEDVLEEDDVATHRVVQPLGAAHLLGGRHHGGQLAAEDEVLDLGFLLVGELEPRPGADDLPLFDQFFRRSKGDVARTLIRRGLVHKHLNPAGLQPRKSYRPQCREHAHPAF